MECTLNMEDFKIRAMMIKKNSCSMSYFSADSMQYLPNQARRSSLGKSTSSTIGLQSLGHCMKLIPSTSNQEESGMMIDVPSFSDIEAMILEMDLCPDDSDSFINHEVSRYQNEDAMRQL
uniref:Uncharacterized protein n=1 Tax=Salix viminalis TaxID=40686 RepID=A0A6N2NIH6_SALVM